MKIAILSFVVGALALGWPGRPLIVAASGSCGAERMARITGLAPDRQDLGLGFTFALQSRPLIHERGRRDRLDRPVAPLERLTILAASPGEQNLFVRIGSDGNTACGWLERDAVLLNESAAVAALRYGPQPADRRQLAADGAMFRNPQRVAVAVGTKVHSSSRGAPANEPVRLAVAQGAAVTDLDRRLRMLHVFREERTPTGTWYLVGIAQATTRLLGWVRADDVQMVPNGASMALPGSLAFEPATLSLLHAFATTACNTLASGLGTLLRDLDAALGPEELRRYAGPFPLLTDGFDVPATAVPVGLRRSWSDLDDELRHAPQARRTSYQRDACRVADLLAAARRDEARVRRPDDQLTVGLVPVGILTMGE